MVSLEAVVEVALFFQNSFSLWEMKRSHEENERFKWVKCECGWSVFRKMLTNLIWIDKDELLCRSLSPTWARLTSEATSFITMLRIKWYGSNIVMNTLIRTENTIFFKLKKQANRKRRHKTYTKPHPMIIFLLSIFHLSICHRRFRWIFFFSCNRFHLFSVRSSRFFDFGNSFPWNIENHEAKYDFHLWKRFRCWRKVFAFLSASSFVVESKRFHLSAIHPENTFAAWLNVYNAISHFVTTRF